MDPNITTLSWAEKALARKGRPPIGSRRRRAAVRQTPEIPFEQLPYHCFQEARKILKEDREEKLQLIQQTVQRIKNVEAQPATTYRGGEGFKNKRLASLRKELEELKIQADINDPIVKRKFEDGQGKPIGTGELVLDNPKLLINWQATFRNLSIVSSRERSGRAWPTRSSLSV